MGDVVWMEPESGGELKAILTLSSERERSEEQIRHRGKNLDHHQGLKERVCVCFQVARFPVLCLA